MVLKSNPFKFFKGDLPNVSIPNVKSVKVTMPEANILDDHIAEKERNSEKNIVLQELHEEKSALLKGTRKHQKGDVL